MMSRVALTLCLLCLYSLGFSMLASAAPTVGTDLTSLSTTPPGAITVLPDAPTVGEAFGSALALDGNILVVGAPGADVGENEQQGAAYVFAHTGDNQWQQVKRITASDGNAFDGFGSAVAVHGDIIVVGAPYAEITPDETNQGAAYVFARNEGGANHWGQVTKLSGSLGDRLDNFGGAVAVHGDDIFVAAANQGNGMVYHCRRDLGGENQWGEAQQLFDAAGRQNDNYGSALAFDGATLVVGAARTDITGPFENDGAAFVYAFDADLDAWQETAKLSAGDADAATANDNFGHAVALFNDVIAVGAPFAEGDADAASVGKVYVFERNQDQWLETDTLTASQPAALTYFGVALVAVAEGILVYADQENGAIYAFQSAPMSASQAQAEWQEIARYTAGEDFFQSGYGRVMAAAEGRLAIGAPQHDLATGGVYLHALEEVFTAPASPQTFFAFLPTLRFQLPGLAITGQLEDGGKVFGPDGVALAAPQGSLTAPVAVSLLRAAPSTVEHDEQVQPIGSQYVIGAQVPTSTPMSRPLLLALPVDAGLDTTHLALAALISPATVQDIGDVEDAAWLYFEGEYDASNQRFLTTWPSLSPAGVTVALVQHPSFDAQAVSPTAYTAASAGATQIQFKVRCLGFYGAGDCTHDTEAAAASYLSQIHARMTDAGGFNFDEPRLRNLAEDLDFDANSLASLGFTAYIERNTSRYCFGNDGYYQIETGRLVVCLAPGNSIDDSEVAALIHEYFHATQYGYSQVYQDFENGDKEDWVIEGMAAAAEESYYLDQGLRRSDDFGLHHVDISLTSHASTDEYRAQDFWVYVGKRLSGANLGYFKDILRYGASLAAVDEGLRQHFNTNFKDQLWDWASNQIIEKEENLDHALGDACALEQAALQFGIQYPWNLLSAPQTSYWPTGGGNATVPPYTTMVVQLIFPYNSPVQNVMLLYPECENNTDYDAWVQCNRNAQDRLPAQMYTEGLPGCVDEDQGRLLDPAFNSTTFRPVQRNRRYFTVVTNVTDSDQVFKLVAELGGP
jgi:hypothetical protein